MEKNGGYLVLVIQRCKVYIVLAKTNNLTENKHNNHSMFVVPSDTDGIKILRPMQVYGHDDAWAHAHKF